ncbi:MAG: DUF1273 family protein [Clostridia bacterium]|nr:DUF1273 family protein [Clostridia bacterium]
MNEKRTLGEIVEDCKEIDKSLSDKNVCFTGHRSQKLPWGFNENDVRCIITRLKVYKSILRAIENGKRHFISGMALGFDMMCAEIVLELKKRNKGIILECAIPCKGQESRWPIDEQKRYKKILKRADKIRCIYDSYTPECLHERNQYMVNVSSQVIALFDGKPGGTKKTIDYAKQIGKEIEIIKPKDDFDISSEEELMLKERGLSYEAGKIIKIKYHHKKK